MNEFSPYQAPAAVPPPMTPPSSLAPASVKAFGVIHLVFAGLGLLMGLWSVGSPLFMKAFLDPSDPSAAAQLQIQEELQWISLLTGGFILALTVLLLVSGLKLVRSQPDGIRWSNRYAWLSIATKMISLLLTVVYVLPVTNRMMDEILRSSPGMPAGAVDQMSGWVKSFTAVTSIASPVVACLYPALALYFLSRPAVKAWAATR